MCDHLSFSSTTNCIQLNVLSLLNKNQFFIIWSKGVGKSRRAWLQELKVANLIFVYPVCAWTIKKTEERASIWEKTKMVAILLNYLEAGKYAITSVLTNVPCLITEESMLGQTVSQHHIENRSVLAQVLKRKSLQVCKKIVQKDFPVTRKAKFILEDFKATTLVNIDGFELELRHHPDKNFVSYFISRLGGG